MIIEEIIFTILDLEEDINIIRMIVMIIIDQNSIVTVDISVHVLTL